MALGTGQWELRQLKAHNFSGISEVQMFSLLLRECGMLPGPASQHFAMFGDIPTLCISVGDRDDSQCRHTQG